MPETENQYEAVEANNETSDKVDEKTDKEFAFLQDKPDYLSQLPSSLEMWISNMKISDEDQKKIDDAIALLEDVKGENLLWKSNSKEVVNWWTEAKEDMAQQAHRFDFWRHDVNVVAPQNYTKTSRNIVNSESVDYS